MFGRRKKAEAINLDHLSYSQLKELHAQVDLLMQAQFSEAQESFRRDFLDKMEEFGLTIDDLIEKRAKKARGEKKKREVRAKYRDPETGEEWTGLGKPKKWLQAKLAAGHTLEEFAIQENGHA